MAGLPASRASQASPPTAGDARKSTKAAEEKFVHALPFLAIGRVGKPGHPAVTLATFDCADSDDQRARVQEIFKKLLTAAAKKLVAGQKTRLQWNEGSVCCMRDSTGNLLYCLVTANMDYPERFAYQCMTDLNQQLTGMTDAFKRATAGSDGDENILQEEMQAPMRELIEKYENPHSPELEAAMSKIIVTKQRMQAGVNQMGANRQEVQDLERSTGALAASSANLQRSGRDLHSRMWWQNPMVMAALCAIVTLLIILCVWYFSSGRTTS